jgi:hypothetical protein
VSAETVRRLRERYGECRYQLSDERDRPILELIDDPDPAFRPCAALLETIDEFDQRPTTIRPVYQLDRPVLPLLNALFALGLVTNTSCAGHRAEDSLSPHVSVDGLSSRAAEAFRVLAQHLPMVRVSYSEHRRCGLGQPIFKRMTAHWGFAEIEDPRRGYRESQLAEFDAGVLAATETLNGTRPTLAGMAESAAGQLTSRVAGLVGGSPLAFPTGGGAGWLTAPELDDGDVLGVVLTDAGRTAWELGPCEAGWRLQAELSRRTVGWIDLWGWEVRAESFAELSARVARDLP